MKILLIGGTGVISSEIVRQALEQGHEVTTFNRGVHRSAFTGKVRTIIGDRRNQEDFVAKLKGEEQDVVIDMISFNAQDAKQTYEALSGHTGQLIFTSSVAAYQRPYHSFPVREEDEVLLSTPEFTYGFEKANMERYLSDRMKDGATPITVIRPSLTFGPGKGMGVLRQNYNIISRIKQNKPLLTFGDGTILWAFTFTPDLAKGYLMACKNPAAYNECFHIANETLGMWEDFYTTFGRLVGKEVVFAYAPSRSLAKAMPSLFDHLEYEKKYCAIFDCDKFRKAAPAFKATVTLEEGLAGMLRYWESQGCVVDEEIDALEDRLCAACADFEAKLIETAR